ncbi:MAG TPA: hypothetical protein VGD56_10245 [Gemmatirosa sp.]
MDDQNKDTHHELTGPNADRLKELAEKHGGMSKGMTSPDSTEAPLRASDGEPDEDAIGGRNKNPSLGNS